MKKIRVTVWNENWDEVRFANVRALYPKGIHGALQSFLEQQEDFIVRTATPQDADFGLSQDILNATDVLIWWGHVIHHLVPDDAVDRVCKRVLNGMGFIPLHSSLYSRPFERLVGGVMNSAYREIGEKERVWIVNPAHEISFGLNACFEIQHSEAYREPTGFPLPDELITISWYAGGEAGISGGCYYRGRGRIFAFTPGHEDYPIFYNPWVQRVIINATRWAYNPSMPQYDAGEVPPYEILNESDLIRIHKERE